MRHLATLSLALALTLAACATPGSTGNPVGHPTSFQARVDRVQAIYDASKPLIEAGLAFAPDQAATVHKAEADLEAAFMVARAVLTDDARVSALDRAAAALATIKPAIEAAIAGASPETIAKVHTAEAVLEVGIAELRVLQP